MKFKLALATLMAVGLSACGQNQTAEAPAAPQAAPTAQLSFQELMLTQIDATADKVWNSVATVSDATGVHEYQPRTDEEWLALRQEVEFLVEAPNLIVLPGRSMKSPVKLPEMDEAADLDVIKGRLDADPDGVKLMAQGLQAVALQLLAAVDRHDVAAIETLGGTLDEACEACHLKYYYPEDAAYYQQDGAGAAANQTGGATANATQQP